MHEAVSKIVSLKQHQLKGTAIFDQTKGKGGDCYFKFQRLQISIQISALVGLIQVWLIPKTMHFYLYRSMAASIFMD